MAALILHIGYPKTGTTFLQLTLAHNRDRFRSAGLDYLSVEELWRDGISAVQMSPNVPLGSLLAHELLFDPPEAAQESWDRIVSRVRASPASYCVLSSEVFSMLPTERVSRLRQLTQDLDVRVLVWLRPQAEAIHSTYLQAVKAGNRLPGFGEYVEKQIASRYLHYRERLKDWEMFGRGRLVVRRYDRSQFPEGDIVQDFCQALGVAVDWETPPQRQAANASIGPKAFALLSRITEHGDGYQRPSREELARAGRRYSAGFDRLDRVFGDIGWKEQPVNLLSTALVNRCNSVYREENIAVARDFLGQGEELFRPTPPQGEVTTVPLLEERDWIQVVGGLLRRTDQVGMPRPSAAKAVKSTLQPDTAVVNRTDVLPTVFHVTHYKAGSQWVYSFLAKLVPDRIVTPKPQAAHVTGSPIQPGAVYPTVYLTRPQLDAVEVSGEQRRIIVLRDLRDTLVSLYFSLRYSHKETDAYVTSIREVLVKLSQQEGLLWLLENRFRLISQVHETWLDGGGFFVKYEELVGDEYKWFERIAGYCGIEVEQKALNEAIRSVSFERLSGRKRGEEDQNSHFRKAVVGDWRSYFDDEIKARFKVKYGDLIIRAGYEDGHDW